MITKKRKKTIEWMVGRYRSHKSFLQTINALPAEQTLSEFLQGVGLTEEEIKYAEENNAKSNR